MRKKYGIEGDLKGQSVIVNGFGKMGSNAAEYLHWKGFKVIGI